MVVSHSGLLAPPKLAMVSGKSKIELARIGGMTPAVLTFSGMCEESPAYSLLPTIRLGYCTKMRRCARSIKTMKAIKASAKQSSAG